MLNTKHDITIIGGGLAGSEAAWQSARRGKKVLLYEMRPHIDTGVHLTDNLGELVCSNSLGSILIDRAPGLLKEELRVLGSLLIQVAEENRIPAGRALAVDRNEFSRAITNILEEEPLITIIREEITSIPDSPTIIASGPLTSNNLSSAISNLVGEDSLYFYDAIAPIVVKRSIDFNKAFYADRYEWDKEQSDYINCPLTEDEYFRFVEKLTNAERIPLRDIDLQVNEGILPQESNYFEACLPVEVLAKRGPRSLAFGPMRPVGLKDPRTGNRPYAVVQLRQDDLAAEYYNLVGFQTNLKHREQDRIFRMIPGLENAEIARFGQMHRNTYINSPKHLSAAMQYKKRSTLYFAGQITGSEGYVSSIGTGLLAGINLVRLLEEKPQIILPRTTMLGAICNYLENCSPDNFQPMKPNFGLLPPIRTDGVKLGKQNKRKLYAKRSIKDLTTILRTGII